VTLFSNPAQRAAFALAATAVLTVAAILLLGDQAYDWVKAIHVIAVIAWMAGMLYLPRLFIYHCDASKGSETSETFKVMERRLLRIIMNPAMILTWVLGLWLAWQQEWYVTTWFQLKFALVLAMSAAHGHLSASVRRFAEDRNHRSARYWRMMNEVPTLLMIAIVILVIVKPF
jgi:putative membrane protein